MDGAGNVYQRSGFDHLHFFTTAGESNDMSKLWKQSAAGERKMSALRKRLKRPETYLFLLFLVFASVLLDSARSPEKQMTARGYIAGVHLYQKIGRPLLAGRVVCRYRPTCSDYSVQAVRAHGIWRGAKLTIARIHSCTGDVPAGTYDPVPDN